MAYIVDYLQAYTASAQSSFTPSLPAHSPGDLLLAMCVNDGGGTTITVGGDWAIIGTQAAAGGVRSVWAYLIADSSSETAPTFSGANDEWSGCTIVVRDAHATAPFGSLVSGTDFLRTDWTAGYSAQAGQITTAVDECLLLYSWGVDSTPDFYIPPESAIIIDRLKRSNDSHVVAFTQQQSASTTPQPTVYMTVSDSGNSWVLAIRNKSGGRLQPCVRPERTGLYFYGNLGTYHDPALTWQAPSALTSAIKGVSCSSSIPTISTTSYDGLIWGAATRFQCTENTTALWCGGFHTISSPGIDFTGKIFSALVILGGNVNYYNKDAAIVVFSDGTNWSAFKIWEMEAAFDNTFPNVYISPNATPYDSSGTLDWSAITGIGYFVNRTGSTATSSTIYVKAAELWGGVSITGGSVSNPATPSDYINQFNIVWEYTPNYHQINGIGQALIYLPLSIGDGTNKTCFSNSGYSVESPKTQSFIRKTKQIDWYGAGGDLSIRIKASAADSINVSQSIMQTQTEHDFTIDSTSSTSATYNFSGLSCIGFDPEWKTGITCNSAIFSGCAEVDGKAAAFTSCAFNAANETHALALDAGASVAGSSFTKGSDTYALKLREAGTYNLEGCTFSGYTTPIKITATTGTVTLQLASGQTQPAYSSDGATVVYSQPQKEYGISISGLVAGSQVVIYEAGTITEVDRDDNTGTTYEWSELGTSLEVDYTIQKAGYLPQRFAGLTLTSVQESSGNQLVDRAYVESSGLTFGSTGTVTVGTKLFGLTTASTGKNWYSFLIESWIAQSSLRNVDFPALHDGDESFTLLDGWEFSSTNWTYLRRCGLRYLDASNVLTATFAGLLSIGDIGSNTAQIQQSDGGNQVAASATGDIDQLIQIYGDSTHGSLDFTGHLVAKAQVNGYITAAYDVIADGGVSALADKLYSFPLNLVDAGIATGNPGITGVSITDHGASPVTWNSKAFSITITDTGSNSGADIVRWINYNLAQGGTFQGKATFNWHDMVLPNGDGYKTIRGTIYGDTGATLKGVRVLRETDAHPDFNLFTADDGTTYSPPQLASVTISGAVTGSLIQLWDTVADEELYIGTGPYYWSETYSADRTIRLRAMYCDADSATIFKEEIIGNITEASPVLAYLLSQAEDAVYAANGIDGSTVTGITIDDSHLLIEVDSASISYPEIYAYETYWLSTEDGIRDETRIITATDTANYIFSGFKIKNIGTGPLLITGGYGRDADTGSVLDMMDTTGLSIFPAPDHVVPYAAGAEATVATVQAGLSAQGYTGARAGKIDNLDAAISSIEPDNDGIAFLQKIVKNKRAITAEASGKALVVYDDDDTTPILSKPLADKDGGAISDLAAGILAQEGKSTA